MQRIARTVQWDGDNAAQIDKLLANHQARADKKADKLHIVGLGLNVTLELGDSVIVKDDRLGIQRKSAKPTPDPFVTWEGNNLYKLQRFLKAYAVRLEVIGARLLLHGDTTGTPWFELKYGDRLVKRDGHIIVSKLGKTH